MTKKIFETKKINMETLPEYLKAARESFSYDLKKVAKVTNISEKFLYALEEGFYHRLPADVYVYGFLRKLAELYRADSDILIHEYKKERGIHEHVQRAQASSSNIQPQIYRPTMPSKIAITPKTLAVASVVALVLFVVGYIAYQVQAINRPPIIKVSDPADGSVVHTSSVVLQGQTDVGVNLSVDGQAVAVDSSGNFKEPISVSPGAKVLNIVAINSFGKQSSKQISIIGDFPNQTITTVAQQQTDFNLTISVSPHPTVISVTLDDSQPQVEPFDKDTSKTYTAHQKILVSTADAGSTYVQLGNGQKFKLGKDGESLSDLVFTPDSTALPLSSIKR